MKIAVASNNKTSVAGHVGRCKGFLIYETDENNILDKTYIDNTFTHHRLHPHEDHQHGHHHGEGGGHDHEKLVQALNGCSAFIFQSGGLRIIEDLNANGIKPVLTDERMADDAVNKYLNGSLIIKEDNSCHHE